MVSTVFSCSEWDIKGMLHQIHLLSADKSVLRFIWRGMQRTEEPKIYEWQVLPFDTTCSSCCAIYTLQRHVQDTGESNSHLVECVDQSFYVDNCLHSTHTQEEAKGFVDGLRQLLHTGTLEIRFPNPAQTSRSQLSDYNGIASMTP